VKPSYLFVPLALFLAGCSTCPQNRHIGGAASLSETQQGGCIRKAADASGAQYRLSDLASETVFDKAGNQVARLDDLTMSANGRVVSLTLTPISGGGSKVTVPFEKVRFKKERNGTVSLETDVVLKGPADGAPVPAVRKWFHFWKKPA
jgi:sporulation protein YlmC with PRC-barrel domain